MKKQIDPNDYEQDDEYDGRQSTLLPHRRHDPKRSISEDTLAIASDPSLYARQVSRIVAHDPRVLPVYVFGSYARGETGPASDLDLAVLLTRIAPAAALRAELQDAFSALSDGIPVDLIILNQARIELAYAVISQGKVLYERSVADPVEYEANVSLHGDQQAFLAALRTDGNELGCASVGENAAGD